MSSRQYIKRIWRVPKDRGAQEYFATLVIKALVKHGWPATWEDAPSIDVFIEHGWPVTWQDEPPIDGFIIKHIEGGGSLPPDFQAAMEIAVRIVARTYRVDVTQFSNWVGFNAFYVVSTGGHFKKVPS